MSEEPPVPTVDAVTEEKPNLAPQRSGLMGTVAGGALAAAMGFGLALYLLPQGWKAAEADPALLERLDRLEQAMQTPVQPDLSALDTFETRLGQIESTLDQPNEQWEQLSQRLQTVEQGLEVLKARPAGLVGQADSTEALARIEAATKEAEAQLARNKAEAAEAARSARIMAAMARLSGDMQDGLAYASSLSALEAEGLQAPDLVLASAITGLPSLGTLQADFPAAARAALAVALRDQPTEGWTDRIGLFLRSQTGARSLTPQEGDDPDAILSRAEAALAKGDLTTALQELTGLSPEAQAAMADWLEQANRRQQTLEALAGWQPK